MVSLSLMSQGVSQEQILSFLIASAKVSSACQRVKWMMTVDN
jgi:hypothetical protein